MSRYYDQPSLTDPVTFILATVALIITNIKYRDL